MAKAGRIKPAEKSGRGRAVFFAGAMIILFAVVCVCGYMIVRYYMDAAKTKADFHDLANQIAVQTEQENTDSGSQELAWTVESQYGTLFAQNADMLGWLSIPDTAIDFPVMHTPGDPEFYLRRNFMKEYSEDGTPFMAANCMINPASDNMIIYGHNMSTGTMFAPLEKYKDQSFYKSHSKIYFDTKAGFGTYEIFGMFETEITQFKYYEFIDAADETAFDAFIRRVKELSFYDTGVRAGYGDQLITLSTCNNITDTGRYVIVAKKISDKHE